MHVHVLVYLDNTYTMVDNEQSQCNYNTDTGRIGNINS